MLQILKVSNLVHNDKENDVPTSKKGDYLNITKIYRYEP